MTFQYIAEHLLLSLAPWLAGSILGAAGGYGIASLIKKLVVSSAGLRGPLLLAPWRTIIMALLLIVYSPLIVVWVGLGSRAAFLTVGVIVFLLALAVDTGIFLENIYPTSLAVRLVATARTLATSSIIITIFASVFGAGSGIGQLLIQHLNLLDSSFLFSTWLIVVAMTLLVDLLLGIPQLLLFSRQSTLAI
jgi:ABC-type nitrate/sulfonate/bicarbonate transport system permease component